jgi:aminoglycoside phosphotransferase (APT) family kinase protein
MPDFDEILKRYPIRISNLTVEPFGNGLINDTFLVITGNNRYILQKVNTKVFQNPEAIASNLQVAAEYINKNTPEYTFIIPLQTTDNQLFTLQKKEYWRLTNFLENSFSVNIVSTADEAFEAAKAFATLTKNLHGISSEKFESTIAAFHNLSLRFQQFEEAVVFSEAKRTEKAKELIEHYLSQRHLVETYEHLLSDKEMPVRIMHHDTKINNALFDRTTKKAVTVCDLDTLMPGRIISDIGDMFRTYLSPVSEDSIDFEKITIRKEIYEAIKTGYLSELSSVLTETEKQHLNYGGEFMIYMQGIRFLADYLNGDIYYPVKHSEHNFDRAMNQWVLLKAFQEFVARK